jgi:hypothetical protein
MFIKLYSPRLSFIQLIAGWSIFASTVLLIVFTVVKPDLKPAPVIDGLSALILFCLSGVLITWQARKYGVEKSGWLGVGGKAMRTTIGGHHEENSPGDGRYRRILCTLIRANAQDNRPGAAIVLLGSGHRDHEMSNRRDPACCWWQHEGCRCCSLDKGISRGGFEG